MDNNSPLPSYLDDTPDRHHHGHLHAHGHHHSATTLRHISKVLVAGIVLNLLYVIVEGGIGFYSSSMGLVSDAGHNLSDVFSLLLTLIGVKLSLASASKRHTYGYQKGSILIALLNAVILIAAVAVIIVESIRKFSHPVAIDGEIVSWTAGIGILINGLTAWLLMKDQKEDLNIRGAYLHMAADTLVSVGVVVAGLVITFTGWVMIDPIISLAIAALILISTWNMLKESVNLAIDGVPEGIDVDRLMAAIEQLPHVESVHHMHVWALSTTVNAMTLHVVLDHRSNEELVKEEIRRVATASGVTHATIECETELCHDCTCQR